MSDDQPCRLSKRLDLKIQDLRHLEELLIHQDEGSQDRFYYTTTLGEKLKFIRICKSHWLNDEYNIALVIPTQQ
ncbi:hypothetical protein [Aliterella atlantica]|uniref:Uncharacterized protein n=1 Tax=Aliterella atlantica CENA595 TaxID=1618023 RepID=A0A0D8ZLV4_9CYAN|nr:hypothetical protein [Aliterella atlantica]KJH69798.1 hypothetical protein UH38_22065 [Aliterella atlantica CENA595]